MKGVSNVSVDYYTAVIFLCVMFVKSFNFKDVIFISEENFQEIGLYKYLRGYSVFFLFFGKLCMSKSPERLTRIYV